MQNKKIVLTGGGTAGHVMPHMAMLPSFRKKDWQVFYIGTHKIEKTIALQYGIEFKEIKAGKLRRYISFENFLDLFRTFFGFIQSLFILLKINPDVVVSKGGYVSVPVCYAAYILRIPIVTHESDYTPGLANRLLTPIAKKILFSFEETRKYLVKHSNIQLAGIPVREELWQGNPAKGMKICEFSESKPVLLVMGGSLGAMRINDALMVILDDLLLRYNIVHITGKGKKNEINKNGYKAFEYLSDELKDVFSITDIVISRAGANSIFEFLSLNIPMLLIPLQVGSRGDQVDNSKYFEKHNWAVLLEEVNLSAETLKNSISLLEDKKSQIIDSQKQYNHSHINQIVLEAIEEQF